MLFLKKAEKLNVPLRWRSIAKHLIENDPQQFSLLDQDIKDFFSEINKISNFARISNPSIMPQGSSYGLAFSVDSKYLAITHSDPPYISIYNISKNDTFVKLDDPNVLPEIAYNCTFSNNNKYLAVCTYAPPYLLIYKRNGDTFTKLPDLDYPPEGGPPYYLTGTNACVFSSDSKYLVAAIMAPPYIIIYKRDGDSFTRLSDPDVLPDEISPPGLSFSENTNYLALSVWTTPFIIIYKRNGDTFTKLPDPDILPPTSTYEPSFSHNGEYLAIASGRLSEEDPIILIYQRKKDEFFKLVDHIEQPDGEYNAAYSCDFSQDDGYLSVTTYEFPFFHAYRRNNEVFTMLEVLYDLDPNSIGMYCKFSPDCNYLAFTSYDDPRLLIFKRIIEEIV